MDIKFGKILIIISLLTLVFFGACKKEEDEHEQIASYAAENNLNGYFTDSGLYYAVVEEGTGEKPLVTSKVNVAYRAYGMDGVTKDESDYFTSRLENLILGWQEGIPLMKDDGKSILICPSNLAYGKERGIYVFDVTLFSFTN